AWQMLRGSLPDLDGELAVPVISQPASIERDAAGIPTVLASNRRDLAFATGYVHGQDRFFQMDLSRRSAAGELAELVGGVALSRDKRMRLHRFRARARQVLTTFNDEQRALLNAYAEGVNSALAAMSARPFEYIVLRSKPHSWQAEDCLLVLYAMFLDLNDSRADRDVEMSLVARAVPAEVFAWLYPSGSRWDAPLVGTARSEAPIPGPEQLDLREFRNSLSASRSPVPEMLPGSNNWAVAGSLTHDGRAIVANDMHLGLRAPSIFYRARYRMDGPVAIDVTGVTLPGTPVMVAGSNGKVAWGFTNSNGDWSDAVIVRPGRTSNVYLSPEGELPFQTYRERIKVHGGHSEEIIVRETIWGPVRDDLVHPDGEIAVSWIAHAPDAVNIEQLQLETAGSVDDALSIANQMGIPPQNFMTGDAEGNIGWTIAGQVPVRDGRDGRLPVDGSTYSGIVGWLPADQYPRVVNPADGRLWTANSRVVDGEALAKLGDGGYALGARTQQIRDGLRSLDRFTAPDMLGIHLDDRALFLQHWRELLLTVLDDSAVRGKPQRAQYRELVANWIPRASVDSVGYRLVRAFRDEVHGQVFEMLMTPVRARYPHEVSLRPSRQFEAPLWALVSEQPPHLLTANFASWDDFLLMTLDSVIDKLEVLPGGLAKRTWGERNTAAISHPLSGALPWAARWLDMPRDALPGGRDMPRVQGPAFGASERFAVAPGAETDGYLHLPGGQSGHPLSPYYRRGHADWVEGKASSFMPGTAQHQLRLVPL
ncbi:MAG: penicillin acylase family protein, partial [Woeseia sp.]